ncbi:MAG: hypothetical protein WD336_01045 [Trueperaceae bacterium]
MPHAPSHRPLRIAYLYEHPSWFDATFAELERRDVEVQRWFAPDHVLDPAGPTPEVDLVVNRISPSAPSRGHGRTLGYARDLLRWCEARGVAVLHGSAVQDLETSKALQVELLARLGLPHPRSRLIHDPRQAPAAARTLRFPLLVKPNVGGSGAGIRGFDHAGALDDAVAAGDLDLGPDGLALVQERHRPRGGEIVRVEVLNGEVLYGIRLQLTSPDAFNLCPADVCRLPDADDEGDATVPVRAFEPPADLAAAVLRLTAAAGIEVGGVEALFDDDADGAPVLYDVNALSNFVSDAPQVLGFDPLEPYVDHLIVRAERARSERTHRTVASAA